MGDVFRARDTQSGRVAAVKMLRRNLLHDPAAQERFLRECRLAGKLSHPNVVAVYDSGIAEGHPYYVMELVEGAPLSVVLESPNPDAALSGTDSALGNWRQAALAFAEVAEALHHAHGRKVIHRDIKPSNLMLDRHGRLRVFDFGLAWTEDLLEGTQPDPTGAIGTPRYMSPEQAASRPGWRAPATDVWSLGATIYETLTRKPSFHGDPGEVLLSILKDRPIRPRLLDPRIPKGLKAIVLKCLQRRPSRRYRSAALLAQDLRRFARGARPLPRLGRLVAWLARILDWLARRKSNAGPAPLRP